jgi:hypothetical protein
MASRSNTQPAALRWFLDLIPSLSCLTVEDTANVLSACGVTLQPDKADTLLPIRRFGDVLRLLHEDVSAVLPIPDSLRRTSAATALAKFRDHEAKFRDHDYGFRRKQIELLDRAYRLERRAVYVWEAYRIAREGGLDTPDWVNEYFDVVAHNVYVNLVSPPTAGSIAAAAMQVVGFTPEGIKTLDDGDATRAKSDAALFRLKSGAFNPFVGHADRKMEIVSTVDSIHVLRPLLTTKTHAVKWAARAYGVGVPTVWRFIREHRKATQPLSRTP